MAWKEWLVYGGPEARRIHDAAFPHSPLGDDDELRIVVLHRVNDCCEKWRGAIVARLRALPGIPEERVCWPNVGLRAAFCPECGAKL